MEYPGNVNLTEDKQVQRFLRGSDPFKELKRQVLAKTANIKICKLVTALDECKTFADAYNITQTCLSTQFPPANPALQVLSYVYSFASAEAAGKIYVERLNTGLIDQMVNLNINLPEEVRYKTVANVTQ